MKTVHNITAVLSLFVLSLITADIIAGWMKARNSRNTATPRPVP